MIKKTLFILSMGILIFISHAHAQRNDIKKHPGYVDLSEIKIPDAAEEITDIDLGPALLALAQLGSDEDEDFGEGLSGLLSIRVKSFEVDFDDAEDVRRVMKKIGKKLDNENWTPLIRSRSRGEMTNVSMKIEKGKVVGFFLMSIDEDEGVSFVNVVGGNVDLESIRDFGLGISDSAMDSLEKSLEKF